MASTFSFTNNTVSSNTVPSYDLGILTNYAKIEDEPDTAKLSNTTATLDQGELITYRCSNINRVSSEQVIQHPAPVRNGVQYVAKVEEILRTTDSAGNIIMDEPIVAYVVIRHQRSSNITTGIVDQVYQRLQGAILKSDGTTRFGDMMHSALVPTVS
jgi:hypothetical protein